MGFTYLIIINLYSLVISWFFSDSLTENVGGPAVYGFFAFISIIAGIFSFKFIPDTYVKTVEELSFMYRRKAIAQNPVEIISTTMNLPNSRKISAEDYDDMYLSYITLGDLEMK